MILSFYESLGEGIGRLLCGGMEYCEKRSSADKRYEKARAYYLKIHEMCENIDLVSANKGMIEIIKEAIRCYEETLEFSIEIGDKNAQGYQFMYLGEACWYLSKMEMLEEERYRLFIKVIVSFGMSWSIGEKLNNSDVVDYCKKTFELIKEEAYQLMHLGDKCKETFKHIYDEKWSKKTIVFYKRALVIGLWMGDSKVIDYCEEALGTMNGGYLSKEFYRDGYLTASIFPNIYNINRR